MVFRHHFWQRHRRRDLSARRSRSRPRPAPRNISRLWPPLANQQRSRFRFSIILPQANYEELGELLLEQKQFAKGREAFNQPSLRATIRHMLFITALFAPSALAISPRPSRISRRWSPRSRNSLTTGPLACSRTPMLVPGRLDLAAPLFADVTQFSTTPETLYNYANFLKLENRNAEAREWTQKLLIKQRTLPRLHAARRTPLVPQSESPAKKPSASLTASTPWECSGVTPLCRPSSARHTERHIRENAGEPYRRCRFSVFPYDYPLQAHYNQSNRRKS